MSTKIIAPPELEPITLEEAKLHLRVDGTDEDVLIGLLIIAAREAAEHETWRALMTQTLELGLSCWPCKIYLPHPPVISVTSIKYLDLAGILQTLDPEDYIVDDYSEPAKIVPAYGKCWPMIRHQPNAILVRYEAGYPNITSVPQAIKSWMMLRIGTLYRNREDVAMGQVSELPHADSLLDGYRFLMVS
jgi:uncharacterized phiE125 gp8 family phage protein